MSTDTQVVGLSPLLTCGSDNITLGLPPKTLRFAGGNVIIKLSDEPEDQLLLYESVLARASDRFRLRFSVANRGFACGKEAKNPDTGKNMKVFEYHLTLADRTFTLTDEVINLWPKT